MSDHPCIKRYTAFEGSQRFASGTLKEVASAVFSRLGAEPQEPVLIFDDETGEVVDLDPRIAIPEEGSPEAPKGRGRPKLGVIAREITLLPRHWDWLNAQPGGASVTLRKLVEEARRAGSEQEGKRQAQTRAYRFMSALAGDERGYEDALRALYAQDQPAFEAHMQTWPEDVRAYTCALAAPAFPKGETHA
ncbi:MAG TPA: DUF2239 family protein [Holophaga sp.]|nr:DUF2239 family protein [Holophaga sp.]